MKNCLDCERASTCHNEKLNDMQIIECVRVALDHNHIEQAKEELEIFARRLRNRNITLTDRDMGVV
jgi:hypothetical protein